MKRTRQNGIALVAVIFLIVVIGAALAVMARLSVQSNAQITQSLLQARAKQAAAGGLEWGIQSIVEDQTCEASTTVNLPAYPGYTVTVTCASGAYNRPSQSITLYRLTARAVTGAPGDADYVWTQLDMSVEF